MIIDIHNLKIKCTADSKELEKVVIRPYKYFLSEASNIDFDIEVDVQEIDPPYETLPNLLERFSTPRNIVYKDNDYKIIDYFGKGLIIETNSKTSYKIISKDRNFLRESFYLLVLSLLGQFCDKVGYLRVHGLALSYKDKLFVLTVPPGGGKSTMALSLLNDDGYKLISDDEAIFDKNGHIHCFPTHIGTLDEDRIKDIPDKYFYQVDRMEFGLKYFIDSDYWKSKLDDRNLKDPVFLIAHRVLNGEPSIDKCSKSTLFVALIKNAVVGVGLFQGVEFVFNNSTSEIVSKIITGMKRLILAIKLTMNSRSYHFTLSRNVDKNAQMIKEFITKLD